MWMHITCLYGCNSCCCWGWIERIFLSCAANIYWSLNPSRPGHTIWWVDGGSKNSRRLKEGYRVVKKMFNVQWVFLYYQNAYRSIGWDFIISFHILTTHLILIASGRDKWLLLYFIFLPHAIHMNNFCRIRKTKSTVKWNRIIHHSLFIKREQLGTHTRL